MDRRRIVEDLSRNGVRVVRTRHVLVSWSRVEQVGTTVEASCGCFGIEGRVHTTAACPQIRR